MQQELRVTQASKMNKLRAAVLDLLVTICATIALFFIVLYGICGNGFNYINSQKRYHQKLDQYGLNLGSGKDYETYEAAIQKFYFEYFPKETLEYVKTTYPSVQSIQHAYNVTVLLLPVTPTAENFKTDYFEYYQNESGKFEVNRVASKISGKGGDYYKKSMKDLFYNTYNILPSYLLRFDADFKNAYDTMNSCEGWSRIIAGCLSILVFYFVIPLTKKRHSTLFESIFDIGHVNSNTGYSERKIKMILRNLILVVLPIVGLFWFNRYGIILLIVLPVFANYLVMLLSLDGRELIEKMTYSMSVEIKNSEIFDSKGDEIVYYRDEDKKEISDPEYMEKLKETSDVKTYQSRDDEIREKIKKEKTK